MNIKGLTIREIDEKIRHYVTDYFTGSKITNYAGELFTESYSIGIDEIAIDIDLSEQNTEYVNSKSGYIYLADICEEHKGYDYVIILVSTYDQNIPLYLILQKISEDTGDTENIIIKNFIENKE